MLKAAACDFWTGEVERQIRMKCWEQDTYDIMRVFCGFIIHSDVSLAIGDGIVDVLDLE
jgi:hypothetical protein